ncbi:MAG: heme biosynthesis HemY N-terminal domain-containing protein, partial [Pelagibacteraceae bacterium]
MRNYGLVLLALLALIGITYISGVDLGQVIINYQELTFELTILTAIIYIALLYIGIRMLSSLLDLPITIKALLKRRHQASLKQNIMNALKALEDMNFNKAIKLLNQVSLRSKRGVFLNALTLQLEYLNGIEGHTETLIKEFLPKNQNEKSFIQLLVADYALRHKNFSLAKELLIDTTHNNSSNYLNFLMTLYWIKLKDVEKAYKCLIAQTITDTHAQNKIVRLFFKEYANETNIEIEKIELLLKKVSREFYDDARSLGSLISLY